MADPIPVVPVVTNLSSNIWPKVPIYMWDFKKNDFLKPLTMDPIWIRWFDNLYNRVGGASGDIIYNNTTIGTLIEDGSSASTQQMYDLAQQIAIAIQSSVDCSQQIEDLQQQLNNSVQVSIDFDRDAIYPKVLVGYRALGI